MSARLHLFASAYLSIRAAGRFLLRYAPVRRTGTFLEEKKKICFNVYFKEYVTCVPAPFLKCDKFSLLILVRDAAEN